MSNQKRFKSLVVKQDSNVTNNIKFTKGQQLDIVDEVVYFNGVMFQPNVQKLILNWINENPNLFINDTKNYGRG